MINHLDLIVYENFALTAKYSMVYIANEECPEGNDNLQSTKTLFITPTCTKKTKTKPTKSKNLSPHFFHHSLIIIILWICAREVRNIFK